MENRQHVQIPSSNLEEMGLEMKDLVIYAYLKKHYNHITKESFPSLDTLVKESGISKPTVIKCLDRLQQQGYINIIKKGKYNRYTFSDVNKFEIYSFDFLEDNNLSTSDKAYIICMQPHMYKNPELGIGKVTYSELDIARMLNIDLRTLRKYENHLQQGDNPVLTLVPSKKKDPETGLLINERVFNFEAYNNILALKFREIDDKLNDKVSREDYNKLLREFNEFKKKMTTTEIKEDDIIL